MKDYESNVRQEVKDWKRRILKRPTMLNRVSKKAQTKMNGYIPQKVHQVITEAIKQMITGTLAGTNKITKKPSSSERTLKALDEEMDKKITQFQKAAAVEGAGTGAGGILVGLADFPLLLAIKMKFLMESASLYGHDPEEYEERVFSLYVFQLAFSSEDRKQELIEIIENWDAKKEEVLKLNWQELQQEYRDYIDFVKMLQLVPVIGAAVGAVANYNLLEQLGETAKNCYRIRHFNKNHE
ncbi:MULTISPECIES: EcsC family protein [Bacillaceae]|uniref:EcsC family protein n=1 Tax=Bacillaceae TaxID=186817 RepID=UPI001E489C70|nr:MULTISPECIES: EcsC family protein [Bacillaceae]MCE4051056.1 EcsC family protein [Bacillus sp. Au-Bac7]MCM3030339.1 EcsC family protein [Niallia sp. MER 6]MDL0436780.1 EcsC family protein [Niallia sp. SS-2023]UPO88304.1 EcsC family protein [Niallia sp. Man26]